MSRTSRVGHDVQLENSLTSLPSAARSVAYVLPHPAEFVTIPISFRFRETKDQPPGFASSNRRTEEDEA
jgi:hypothetical protein